MIFIIKVAARLETMKRVNIKLSDEAHTKAKIIAVLKDTTLNDYLEQAIQDALGKDKHILQKIKK